MLRMGLQDDIYLVGSARAIVGIMPEFTGRFADVGHHVLRTHKFSAGAPGFEDIDQHDLPECLRRVVKLLPNKIKGVGFVWRCGRG